MKAVYKLVAGLAVAGFAVSVAIAEFPAPRKVSVSADGGAPAVAATAAGLNYATGFESTDVPPYLTCGYIPNVNGFFPDGCGSAAAPCFGHTAGAGFSLITPTLECGTHPFGGTQHLRVASDPSTRTNIAGFGLGVDARFPQTAHLSARPIDANTVSIMVSVDAPFGSNYRIQPQSNSQTFLATSTLLYNSGSIYVLDDLCGATGLGFVPAGAFWDTTGGYQNYTVEMNPCTNVVNYSYGGAPLYAGCVIAGSNLEQFLIFSDNFPAPPGFVGRVDVDDLLMRSGDGPCPSVCGNGVVEAPTENCEPGVVECNPGHTCGAPGTQGECTCDAICTLDAPCELNNGANGPFYGPFDPAFGGIFIYNAPGDIAASVETCGSTGGIDNRIFYWGSCSDPGDAGNANDDCYPGYSGADPSASCYGTVTGPNYESCTCHDLPDPLDTCYLLQIRGGATMVAMIEVNKKAVCGEGHLGSCCDTNGPDQGCTDSVLAGDCVGADKRWTENGKCPDANCVCIPDCTGAQCGDDGCGGSCGDCDNGFACDGVETCDTAARLCRPGEPVNCDDGIACTDDECTEPNGVCTHTPDNANCGNGNLCDGIETCDVATGCVPGTPLVCDNGQVCDGAETCNPSSGCVSGAPLNCDDGVECTADSCVEPTGCVNDDADCSIPTVSEWGLVVLALMLLIGAKVYFGRRQAIA